MLRILWTSCEPLDTTNSQQGLLRRTEGGWWYSEETGQDRKAWKVHSRIPCENGVCEVLTSLPEDWIQLPCWLDESHQQVILLREQGQISLQQLMGQNRQQQLLSLWLPLSVQHWPSWVAEVLGSSRHTEVLSLAQSNTISLLCQGPVSPLPQTQQVSARKEGPLLQTPVQRQASHDKPPSRPQGAQQVSSRATRHKPAQQPLKQSSASAAPKAVQTGSLLTPVDLPTGQLPRNLNDRRPVHRGRPGRDRQPRPPVCLLVEE